MPPSNELYDVWAPRDSPWSAWAKPVLFANAPWHSFEDNSTLPDVTAFSYLRQAAVVVDVAGARSVYIGLALAQIGFQPVPLYNGAAAPGGLINMGVIAEALAAGANRLRRITRRTDQLPAFLLNADRLDHPNSALLPGRYDNRWAVVPQDMPSASFLRGAGIEQVVLISDRVRDDLAHILYRYQDAGLKVLRTPQCSRRLWRDDAGSGRLQRWRMTPPSPDLC